MSNRRRPSRPELSLHYEQVRLVDDVDKELANLERYRCQDCDSEIEPHRYGPQLVRLEIRHDPTCPWLRQRVS